MICRDGTPLSTSTGVSDPSVPMNPVEFYTQNRGPLLAIALGVMVPTLGLWGLAAFGYSGEKVPPGAVGLGLSALALVAGYTFYRVRHWVRGGR